MRRISSQCSKCVTQALERLKDHLGACSRAECWYFQHSINPVCADSYTPGSGLPHDFSGKNK